MNFLNLKYSHGFPNKEKKLNKLSKSHAEINSQGFFLPQAFLEIGTESQLSFLLSLLYHMHIDSYSHRH